MVSCFSTDLYRYFLNERGASNQVLPTSFSFYSDENHVIIYKSSEQPWTDDTTF